MSRLLADERELVEVEAGMSEQAGLTRGLGGRRYSARCHICWYEGAALPLADAVADARAHRAGHRWSAS